MKRKSKKLLEAKLEINPNQLELFPLTVEDIVNHFTPKNIVVNKKELLILPNNYHN